MVQVLLVEDAVRGTKESVEVKELVVGGGVDSGNEQEFVVSGQRFVATADIDSASDAADAKDGAGEEIAIKLEAGVAPRFKSTFCSELEDGSKFRIAVAGWGWGRGGCRTWS